MWFSSENLGNDASASLRLDKVTDSVGRVGTRVPVSMHSLKHCKVDSRILVGRSPAAFLGDLNIAVSEDVVTLDSEALLGTIKVGNDSTADVGERVFLDKHLSTHTRVNAGCWDILVAGAVDVGSSETDRGSTAVDLRPVVVVVSDLQGTAVLAAVAVGVAHKTGLPVVMEFGPRNGDKVSASLGIGKSIVAILVSDNTLVGQVAVVDPDVGGALNLNEILSFGRVGHQQVSDDDILCLLDSETSVGHTY